jgi:hypothetical protein
VNVKPFPTSPSAWHPPVIRIGTYEDKNLIIIVCDAIYKVCAAKETTTPVLCYKDLFPMILVGAKITPLGVEGPYTQGQAVNGSRCTAQRVNI